MSLHFLYGRAGTGKTTRCCEEISRCIAAHPEEAVYFIVPDQTTYRAESMLAAACRGGGFAGVQVCGFSRLAYRVFQELRTDTNEALSPLVQQLVLRRLLTDRRKEFRAIQDAARHPHFAKSMTAFLHQLDSFSVDGEALSRAAAAEGDSPLGRKLADLALLSRSYQDYLRSHFKYRGNMYDKLAEDIPRSPTLRRARIWIDGWSGMTPQELSIVSALIRTARDVTVTLPMDPPEEAASLPLFDRPYRMWAALQKSAGRADAAVLTEPVRFLCPRLRETAVHFFTALPRPCRYPKATRVLPEQGLFLTKAPSRAAEVDDTARQIQLLVREKGFRYRDILVILRQSDAYADRLRRSFAAYGIPAFIDQPRPMKNHPLVILTESLLRFLAAGCRGPWQGWTRTTLFQLLKTDLLSAFSPDDVDRLENYVLRIGIRPSQWQAAWKFHSPFHLEQDDGMPTPRELDELNQMNACRRRLLDFLIPLEDQWKDAVSVREKCALLYRWLMAQHVPDTLARWDQKAYDETRERPHLQVWKKLLLLLDDFVRAAGSDPMDSDEFLALMKDGLDSLTFSLIPPTLDHVTVTTIDRGYAMEGRAVFLLGANEGCFPARIEESGILSEAEKRALKDRQDLILGPDLLSLIDQEAFYTHLALTRAREALYLSYTAADDDGSPLSPSSLLTQLIRLGYYTAQRTAAVPGPDTEDPSFLVRPAQALSLLPAVLREGLPGDRSIWHPLRDWALGRPAAARLLAQKVQGLSYTNQAAPLPPAVVQKLFHPGRPFSVTRLETYRKCPYQFFLRYGLKLDERDQSRMDKRDFGNYLHAGLHRFGDFMKSQQKEWRSATDEDIDRLSADIAARIAPRVKSGALLSDAAARYTRQALDRTFRAALRRLRRWSAAGQTETIAMEQNFRLKLTAEQESLLIDCHIDRVDQAAGGAIVCDYKTGAPRLSLQEIVTGCRIQLITYLMAVIDSGRKDLLPGALLYIYLEGDTRSVPVPSGGIPDAPSKNQELSGYFLDDRDFLTAMDSHLGTDDGYLPISYTKKGAPSARSPVLSMEELRALLGAARAQLLSLHSAVRSGAIPIRPVRFKGAAPCTYCLYKSICRFDPRLPGNTYDDIPVRPDKEVKEDLKPEQA